MKLTDVEISACIGDDNPALMHNGERSYFPHIHVGPERCSNPRYYKPSSVYDDVPLAPAFGNHLTINQAGPHNHDGQKPFDALADLFASAPELLRLLEVMITHEMPGNREPVSDGDFARAKALVARLMSYDIPEADETGWGPYFNKDGTPWKASNA